MFRKLATLTAVMGMFAIGQAGAADLPRKAPPAPPAPIPFTWTGFYTGIYGGYGFNGQVDAGLGGFAPSFVTSLDPSGGFGGTNFGYNWQFAPNWVFGLEADFSYGRIQDSVGFAALGPLGPFGLTSRLDYFGTVRGRLGVTWGTWLLYGTGGFAWGHNEGLLDVAVGGGAAQLFDDNFHTGWTAGGGVEWAINRNWSVKAEYLFVDLSGKDYNFVSNALPVNLDLSFHTVKVGANFRFDLGSLFGYSSYSTY